MQIKQLSLEMDSTAIFSQLLKAPCPFWLVELRERVAA